MTVVTRNVADFEPTGVEILNPWKGIARFSNLAIFIGRFYLGLNEG